MKRSLFISVLSLVLVSVAHAIPAKDISVCVENTKEKDVVVERVKAPTGEATHEIKKDILVESGYLKGHPELTMYNKVLSGSFIYSGNYMSGQSTESDDCAYLDASFKEAGPNGLTEMVLGCFVYNPESEGNPYSLATVYTSGLMICK